MEIEWKDTGMGDSVGIPMHRGKQSGHHRWIIVAHMEFDSVWNVILIQSPFIEMFMGQAQEFAVAKEIAEQKDTAKLRKELRMLNLLVEKALDE